MDFFHAVLMNDLYGLQEALMEQPNLDVNASRIGSMTALHVAAHKGYTSCVTILLSAGANVDETDQFGYTALMNAVSLPGPWQLVVRKLIQANCNCNLLDHKGNTALHLACRTSYPGLTIVTQLMEAGAKVDAVNSGGETPLSIAVETGSTDAVQDLLFAGPYLDPNRSLGLRGPPCNTPVHHAMRHGFFRLARSLILAGYNAHEQIQQYKNDVNSENTPIISLPLSSSEVYHRDYLLEHGLSPLSLQRLCRNVIRRCLGDNMEQAGTLGLPTKITDYLLFKDFYAPKEPSTMHSVSSVGIEFVEEF